MSFVKDAAWFRWMSDCQNGGGGGVVAGPWRVRFVESAVLAPFRQEDEWKLSPVVLRRATAALGYVPWVLFAEDGAAHNGVRAVCPFCFDFGSVRWASADARASLWQYNGDPDQPTLTHSVQVGGLCHLHVWVRDGWLIDAGTPPHSQPEGIARLA